MDITGSGCTNTACPPAAKAPTLLRPATAHCPLSSAPALLKLLLLLLLCYQVGHASPQVIVLTSMSGWGVNGSLVTLLPDTPLPQLEPSAPNSHGLSSGAVAGIVVGSIAGAALLLGGAALLLRSWRRCGGWEGFIGGEGVGFTGLGLGWEGFSGAEGIGLRGADGVAWYWLHISACLYPKSLPVT